MRINHYQNTAIAEGLFLTYLVQKEDNVGSNEWSNLYSSIDGFEYESGFIYDIEVSVEKISNPPADGSSLKYTLKEIISTEKVDDETTFDLILKIGNESFITQTSGYQILNKIDVDCNVLCDELDIQLQNKEELIGTFKRVDSDKIALIKLE
ncbi:DUF4377 domain-containing protein [Polaribacter sp. DS7-9]|nr:DUF4377 domain-containing protein [Polaribacter sp. DS7-9]